MNTDTALTTNPTKATRIAWLKAISTGATNRLTLYQAIIRAKKTSRMAPTNPPSAFILPVPKL